MLSLEVVHQLILPGEPVHALARAVTVGAVEVLGTGSMAFHVTCKVVLVLEGMSAASVGARETTGGGRGGDSSRCVDRGGGRDDNRLSVSILEVAVDRSCTDLLVSNKSRSKPRWVIIKVVFELCEA